MISVPNISRFRAATIHLLLSALIAALVLVVMLQFWYPRPFFAAVGGLELIALIVGIDVCMGPLMTLVIFDPRKKELLFDLCVVAILQLAALGYGVYAMHAGRPVFVAFVENKFAVVTAAQLEDKALGQALPEFRQLSLTGPRYVAVEMPSDPKELQDVLFAGLSGLGAQHVPKYYRPYADHTREILAAARKLEALSTSPEDAIKLQQAVDQSGRKRENLRFLPVVTERAMLTALLDGESAEVVGLLDVRPAKVLP